MEQGFPVKETTKRLLDVLIDIARQSPETRKYVQEEMVQAGLHMNPIAWRVLQEPGYESYVGGLRDEMQNS